MFAHTFPIVHTADYLSAGSSPFNDLTFHRHEHMGRACYAMKVTAPLSSSFLMITHTVFIYSKCTCDTFK